MKNIDYNKDMITQAGDFMTTYSVISPKDDKKGYGLKITNVKYIEDISSDYNAVKKLADTCNCCNVEMEFFPDVLDNFLSDYETF